MSSHKSPNSPAGPPLGRGSAHPQPGRVSTAIAPGGDDPGALRKLASSYFDRGQLRRAHHCYERLVEFLPRSADAHHRLGTVQEELGDWEAAAASYRRALELQPASPGIHASLARLLCRWEDWAEAVESCRRAVALAPRRPEFHNLHGYALVNRGDYCAAVEAYRRALLLQPDSPYAVYGLGYLFERQGDLVSAADSYRLALKLDPGLLEARLHLGITHFLRGELGRAKRCFEQVCRADPHNAESHTFIGHIHLLQGNFSLGWREHEWRWKTPHFLRHRRTFPQPLWQGEPLAGARILLHAEQGLGDTLQFVRYVPLVAAMGGKVALEVQSRLYRLLAETPGTSKVIRRGEPLPPVDWQCPLLSIPRALATDLNSIPSCIPYVHPDPARAAEWAERLAGDTLRVGLVWGGNPTFPHERWRAIPLEMLAPLTRLEGITFYSLQMGPAAGQIKQLGSRLRLVDLQYQQADLADTAAIVANLSLVISVDTSVAHLAGAMGKPVWILLHQSPDWRWLLQRQSSPWYPTARLLRQSTLGRWQDVVARVEVALRELVARVDAVGRSQPP